ncbi:MAG: DUF3237 domain-containing protein [Actinomycetia bacterium]|nr:DUF3237 domain-containing protein [Actinomycetes bacterium]
MEHIRRRGEIFVTYLGYLVDGVLKTSPRFETGDERYAWLDRVLAVGIGGPADDGVTYERDPCS